MKGIIANKLTRRVKERLQQEQIQKFEDVIYEYEQLLGNLDAEFQEFAESTCERLEKLEE